MKRILTIIWAITFSGAALSAQNNVETIKVNRNESDPHYGHKNILNFCKRPFANPAVGLDIARFSLKVGYEYQLGFWGHLDGKHMHNVKLGVAYTF